MKKHHPKNKVVKIYNGTKYTKHLKNGKLHSMDSPAKIIINDSTSTETHLWYRNGNLHRVDGPAIYSIDKDGVLNERWSQFYYKGRRLDEIELKKLNRKNKIRKIVKK